MLTSIYTSVLFRIVKLNEKPFLVTELERNVADSDLQCYSEFEKWILILKHFKVTGFCKMSVKLM